MARKNSYSQNGEDLILIDYFNENPNGFYVDIGCHHPFRFSNTYLLYKKGWRGLNVDANKWTISLFNFFRKRDTNQVSVISDSREAIYYYEFHETALSGILNQDRVSKLLDLGYNLKSKKKINPTPVGEFINRNNLKCKRIDFLKIDIEGMDFKIIKAIPINNLDIDLIMIEKGSKAESKQLLSFLRGKEFNVFFENERNFIFKKSQTNSMDG